jgi:hypothetical protein
VQCSEVGGQMTILVWGKCKRTLALVLYIPRYCITSYGFDCNIQISGSSFVRGCFGNDRRRCNGEFDQGDIPPSLKVIF